MHTSGIRTYSRIALFAALIAAGSYVSVPIPGSPVPVALANLFVVLSGMVLGALNGTLAVLVYLLLGAAGLPVFAAGSGGLAHLVGPTGGYLVGYAPAAAITGVILASFRRGLDRNFTAILVGTAAAGAGIAAVYVPGVAWMAVLLDLGPPAAISTGLLPFLPGDIAKVLLAGAAVPAFTRAGLIPTHPEHVTQSEGHQRA